MLNCFSGSDSLKPHGLRPAWDSPGNNTGMGCYALLQGIFPTQTSNPNLLHCWQTLYCLNHQQSPYYVLAPLTLRVTLCGSSIIVFMCTRKPGHGEASGGPAGRTG